ncbi:glycosyltransferase family 39 protein [Alicyclobacillus dauci]|uniref:Glycosyltransferase family 39 protein n=1 Tax=Alicyclobacillus dauci TaxID=1475485 RepID=A0ABY6YZ36_9BACL|nr:glycosyltransferase family 39 protein [Alicyclobacillus dauci]WAH35895.1 glycosyltransferase family 39 protein [Alicyclobacillus dauci]
MPRKQSQPSKHWIWDILALNLIFRGVWLLFMHPEQKADFLWYFDHAKMLANGQGYNWMGHPTAYWPIGWPFFLSLIFRITGSYVIVGLAVNVILSTVIVGLIYVISMRLFHRQSIAICAAVAYSLLPSHIEWNAILGSEELFTALLLTSLLLYLKARAEGTARPLLWTIASGLILGLSCDVRPIPLAFPIFIFLYELLIARRRFAHSIGRALTLGIAMFVAILPVTIRNLVSMHHMVLVSTNGGVNLWQGTHTNGGYFWSWNPAVNPILHINDEIVKNKVAEHTATDFIFHHIPTTVLHGFMKIWDLYKDDVNSTWYTFHVAPGLDHLTKPIDAINTTFYFLFMAAAAIGIVMVVVRRIGAWRNALLLLTFALYNTCFFFFFPAWDRFRYPLMPLFAVFVGVGLVSAWQAMRNGEREAE